MRISSSRHVVGVETIEETAGIEVPSGKLPDVVFGSGMRATRAAPTAVGVMTCGPLGQSAGSCAQRAVKSPLRSASDGTSWGETAEGFFSLRHSSDQKKNVFFLSEL